jgi:signal transduction histidine kinase/streptogramin lyase
LTSAQNNKIWIGTENGLDLFDAEANLFTHYKNVAGDETSLPHNSLRSTYVDDKGTLWLGCVAGGVRKYDKTLSQFDLYRPINSATLNIKMIFAFAETSSGSIWVGSDGGGLNLFKPEQREFLHVQYNKNDPEHSLKSNTVLCLAKNKNNDDLWVGTYDGGLSYYHSSTKTFSHYTQGNDAKHLSDKNVYALMHDSKGNLWIGTNEGGVNILDKSTNTFTKLLSGLRDSSHLNNSCIRCFYEHRDGTIWIGTYGSGVNIYDPATKKFSYLDKGNTDLNNNIVLSIHCDKRGNVWVGTMGGLNLFDEKKKTFTSLTEENGLVNNVISNIQEDDKGFLWLSTKKGISRVDPITKKIRNYGLTNGLQDYEFCRGSGFTSSTGEIYFGGVNGFNVFDPANMPENYLPPPVLITGFQLFNQPVAIAENSPLKKDISITDSITLPSSKSSVFSFDFIALNFTASEKNQYAYMLEGFDKNWIYCGNNRTATYTNLDPGEYVFHVKASNNDGVWNEKGTSITIIITPPFWQTWWFRLLAVLLLFTCVYTFFKIRIRNIHKQKTLLEVQVLERTQSLANMTLELERKNKELEQFAYVASHDLQEPLRTISSFLDLLHNQYKENFDEKASKYMTFIMQASNRMKVLITDLLEYSRIGRKKESASVDLNQTVKAVLADLNKAISDSGAEITVGELPVIGAYPTEMKQIFQNLIINAIKFRKKDNTPKIEIGAEKKNDLWQFVVKDNGIGIDPNQSERIFMIFQRLHSRNEYEGSGIGLSHCKKIAELHKGKIWVESAPGDGSRFYFTIADLAETCSEKQSHVEEAG